MALELTDDDRNFLARLIHQRIKKKEKESARLEQRPDQTEEEFYDFLERRAHSLRYMRGLLAKLGGES